MDGPDLRGKVLGGYTRLTVDRYGNKIGHDVQRKPILEWAERNGCAIQWYRDSDVTAADLKVIRKEYEEMLSDVEAGLIAGVAVWRLDRLVRLNREFERCFELVENAGGFIVSTSEGMNSLTPDGRTNMRIRVTLAGAEIDSMKARSRAHQQAKAEAGSYGGGGPRPFGFAGAIKDEAGHYLNVGKVGVEHVPDEIKLLRQAAKDILENDKSWLDIVRDWNTREPPILGSTGAPWDTFTLQRVLTGPRALGMREVTEEGPDGKPTKRLVKAVWDPIVDKATWDSLRLTIKPSGKRGRKEAYLLSGVIVCGRCHRALTGARRKYIKGGAMTATMTYRCKSSPDNKVKGSCGKLSVLADDAEKIVVAAILRRIAETPDMFDGIAKNDDEGARKLGELWAVIGECDQKMDDLARAFARPGGISSREWDAAREVLTGEKLKAEREIEKLSRRVKLPMPDGGDLSDLLSWFHDKLSLGQRRKLVELYVRSVSVLPAWHSGRHFDPDRIVLELASTQ